MTITVLGWGVVELALRLRLVSRSRRPRRWRPGTEAAPARTRARAAPEWTLIVIVVSFTAAVLTALFLASLHWGSTGGGAAVVVAGELVALAGIALRVWAILTLDRFFTFVVGIADDHRVVRDGPYRLMRHPGYAGALLTLLGVGIALEHWLSLLLIVAVPALALGVRITVEEARLLEALGPDYADYASRTARLLPGIW